MFRHISKKLWLVRRGIRIGLKRTKRRKIVRRRIHQRKVNSFYHPDIIRKQVRHKVGKIRKDLELPSNFCLLTNHDETLTFFRLLEKTFDARDVKSILVDHTTIKSIGIEAALMLVAEFKRLTSYAPNIKVQGLLKGMCQEAHNLLDGIGYFSYYQGGNPEPDKVVDTQTQYFNIASGKGSDTQTSGKLVESFATGGYMDAQSARRLGTSLAECLDNVSQHAYNGKKIKPFKRQWWLVGYCNKPKREIFFALLDLGVGMPHTLKQRRREADMSLKHLLFGLNDEELIVRAFTDSFSSTKKKNRGLGLPGLKKILDKFGTGELTVLTSQSECRLKPKERPQGRRHKIPLAGTLLTWKLLSQPQNT